MTDRDASSTANMGFRQGRLALGTVVTVTLPGVCPKQGKELAERVFAEVSRIEEILSPFRRGSDIWRLNRTGRCDGARPETLEVMKRALYHSEISGGAFDVTVVPRAKPDKRAAEYPTPGCGRRHGYRDIQIENDTIVFTGEGVSVNLGAIGKGYAVDRAVELLLAAGSERGIVNAGGDLRVIGGRAKEMPWRIGIRNPRKLREMTGEISVEDKAVATSGSYQRETHDIIDPFTGCETRKFDSVSVVADTATDADALVTAMFVMGPEKGLTVLAAVGRAAALWVAADGTVVESPHWKGMCH